MKILDLCICDENEMVYAKTEKEFFGYFECDGDWKGYYKNLKAGSLDKISFTLKDVYKDVFVVDDGGELIRLKDGSYMRICWRGCACRVWPEKDEEFTEYLDSMLNL